MSEVVGGGGKNVRPESKIIADLAEKLIDKNVFDFNAFNQHRDIRKTIAACIPGMEALKDIDVAKKEFHIRNRILHTPAFKTPNGLAAFVTHTTEPLMRDKHYPFKLMTVRSEGQFNSIIYEEKDSYRSVENRSTLLMSVSDMASLGLKSGDKVRVQSDTGSMTSLSVKNFDLPPGNVMTYYPEANVLVGRETDPRSKTPAFKSVAVQIEPNRESAGL